MKAVFAVEPVSESSLSAQHNSALFICCHVYRILGHA